VDLADPAELGDCGLSVGEDFSVPAGLVLDRGNALAFDRARDDQARTVGRGGCQCVRLVDRVDVVAVDGYRRPAEGAGSVEVRVEIPAVHCFAALAEPVDVEDHGQVVELPVGGVLEGLPDRSLGHLAVAGENPDAVGPRVDRLRGERDADADGKAEAERAGGDVDPWQRRAGMALQRAAERAGCEQLFVADRPGRLVDRVEQRRGVALGEDQVVVVRVLWVVEAVAEVLLGEHRDQVGRRHR
jgi:hypothetical protein